MHDNLFMILYILVVSQTKKLRLMQNNEIQTLLQSQYAKLLIYFDLGSGQIRRIRGIYEVAQNVICSSSMCDEYHKN